MSTSTLDSGSSNIVDIFSGKNFTAQQRQRILRLSPEYDGLCMLYSSGNPNGEKFYSMKILCWGIRENGDVVGLVPWLNQLIPGDELNDSVYGRFETYYEPATERTFSTPPPHKLMELETAIQYYDSSRSAKPKQIVQEIPDNIGTHAMLNADDSNTLILTEVLSWRLLNDGSIQAMLVDEAKIDVTPILPGDPCLYPAEENCHFRYFFQHHIANQLKAEDPDALAAIAMLLD